MKQLLRIVSAKSEQRMKAGVKDPVKNSSQGKAREIVANRYDISHDTMKKEIAEVVSYFAERYGIEEERNA